MVAIARPVADDRHTRRELYTEIEIAARPADVWEVLTAFSRYGEWNPWMHQVVGELRVGARLDVRVRMGERELGFRPRVTLVDPPRAFRWLGHLLIPGLFDGEHCFELSSLHNGGTRLVHRERFSGLLVGPVLRRVGAATEEGFKAMNEALRARCEASAARDES